MVPEMPPKVRRKLRAAYPVFGISDLVIRWAVPAGLVLAVLVESWPIAIVALGILVVAWRVRVRQFPHIVQGEGDASLARQVAQGLAEPPPLPGPEHMRSYYETWPLLHREYMHPMVMEPAAVFCPEHGQWEPGIVQAIVSPSFALAQGVNLRVELDYGEHAAWKLDSSTSLVRRGARTYGDISGDLWEVRARNAVDRNLDVIKDHEVAVAMVLPDDNSFGLVKAHLDSLSHWEGIDRMEAEMDVALPD